MVENSLFQTFAADIEGWRSDLMQQYRQVLQQSLFTNRKEMRPAMLGTIATQEVDALLDYFKQAVPSGAARGAQLCETGLGEISVLRLGQASRQFFIASLQNGHLAHMIHAYDEYHNSVMQGFIKKGEKIVLEEQERSRYAEKQVLAREN
jgi:hypothetical protein